MISNDKKIICVDIQCRLPTKIIDNWECLLQHQQLNHKMLALNQLHETLLSIQKIQQSPQNIQIIQNEIKQHEDQIIQTIKIMEENSILMLQNHFEGLTKQLTQQLRQQILQIQIASHLSLDGFYQKIFQLSYQNTAIKQYQEQNSMNWISIEAKKFEQEKEKQFKDFYPQLEQFFKSTFKTDEVKQINQSLPNIQPQQFQEDQYQNVAPLKNYRTTMKLEPEKQQQSGPTYTGVQNFFNPINQSTSSNFTQLSSSNCSQTIPQTQPSQQNIQVIQVDNEDQFDLTNFSYLEVDDILEFSSTCFYGPLELIKNECVFTDGEGMILFEGYINKHIIYDFLLKIVSRAKNFYVEIGVIDWNKFRSPKQRIAQKGVYSYNTRGEIFDDGETKQRQPMIQHDVELLVTYNNECENLIYQVQQNQAISLKKIKNKSKLTFFAKLYKAGLQIIE